MVTAPVMISGLAEDPKSRQFEKSERYKQASGLCAMRLRPPPSPVRRARVARALGRPRGRSLCFRVKSEITDLSHTHIVRRPTDDLQTTGSRESAGGLAAAHERADARWVRCARRRRAPLPRARRARAPRLAFPVRAASGPEPEERLEDHGSLQPALKRSTPMPSTPCRQRAEHARRFII
jgi:hypothetical protein